MAARPARILLVEDELLIAMAVGDTLRDADFVVLGPVRTGEEAVRSVEGDPPDLILLDITLAGRMDGVAAAVECRRYWQGPILFHTAYSDARIRGRIATIANSFFLPKPSGPAELIRAVHTALIADSRS